MTRRFTTDWRDGILESWMGQEGSLRVTSMTAPRSPHGDPLREVSLATQPCGVHRAPRIGTDDPLLLGIPTDALTPDYENRDPLRNVRPDSPRTSARFRPVPSIGQGALRIDRLVPTILPDDPLDGLEGDERESFRKIMEEITGE